MNIEWQNINYNFVSVFSLRRQMVIKICIIVTVGYEKQSNAFFCQTIRMMEAVQYYSVFLSTFIFLLALKWVYLSQIRFQTKQVQAIFFKLSFPSHTSSYSYCWTNLCKKIKLESHESSPMADLGSSFSFSFSFSLL